jgi:hypothetical protein
MAATGLTSLFQSDAELVISGTPGTAHVGLRGRVSIRCGIGDLWDCVITRCPSGSLFQSDAELVISGTVSDLLGWLTCAYARSCANLIGIVDHHHRFIAELAPFVLVTPLADAVRQPHTNPEVQISDASTLSPGWSDIDTSNRAQRVPPMFTRSCAAFSPRCRPTRRPVPAGGGWWSPNHRRLICSGHGICPNARN